jgi:hypothetical protein
VLLLRNLKIKFVVERACAACWALSLELAQAETGTLS